MVTITDDSLGQVVATNGVLQSITMTTPPSDYGDDYFCLTDDERVIYNIHIATSAVSSGSVLMSNASIPFTNLIVKSKSIGSVFELGLDQPS